MALGWRGQYYRYRGYFLDILNLYKQRTELHAFVEVILSVLVIILFLVFALKPTALTIIGLAKTIKEKQTTLSSLDKKINNLGEAQTVYSQSQDSILNVDTAVATKPEPDTISKQVVGLAAKNSVNILSLSIGQVTLIGKEISTKNTSGFKPLPGNAHEIPISISVQGDYPNLIGFAKDFENLRIASKIDLMGINASTTNNESVIVAVISARIPFLGEQ